MGWESQRRKNTEEVPAACHAMEDADPERRMMMGSITGVVCVDMLMVFVVVNVRVLVDLDPPRSKDRPGSDADEQETDKELRPPRPGLDVNKAPQHQPDPSDDADPDAMPESPEDPCASGF